MNLSTRLWQTSHNWQNLWSLINSYHHQSPTTFLIHIILHVQLYINIIICTHYVQVSKFFKLLCWHYIYNMIYMHTCTRTHTHASPPPLPQPHTHWFINTQAPLSLHSFDAAFSLIVRHIIVDKILQTWSLWQLLLLLLAQTGIVTMTSCAKRVLFLRLSNKLQYKKMNLVTINTTEPPLDRHMLFFTNKCSPWPCSCIATKNQLKKVTGTVVVVPCTG